MKTALAAIGIMAIVAMGLIVTLYQIPAITPGPGRSTAEMTAEGFALVREVSNHINRLESDNRNLRAENATLRWAAYRVALLEAFLADNGIPTPAESATFESLKLESN